MTSATVGETRPESKSLRAWWSAFTKVKTANAAKTAKVQAETGVFGQPLRRSLKYASVAISMAGEDGQQYVWGYVPVIVAKVGLYLKENATEVEGVFRIAGSQKRMRELQEVFDTPPRYGKNVDWSKYSVHDAASVLRRYLNQMPEPIIPLHLYNEFRAPMLKEPLDVDAAIKTYKLLINSSPPASQYLLLYVLDLLAVFARKSEVNLMPASNLAVIFQPGMFSHPSHLQSPDEHKVAVQVLEFLIEHQDHFVLSIGPPPPANVAPAELTSVSQPATEETTDLPSDSDEDLGELEVHEGGGAAMARAASQATPSPARRKGLFAGIRGAGRLSPNMRKDQVEEEDIGGQSNAPVALGGGTPSGATVKRSKTTPSRRPSRKDPSKEKDASGETSAAASKETRSPRSHMRRKSSEAGSPSPSAAASPSLGVQPLPPMTPPVGLSSDNPPAGAASATAPPAASAESNIGGLPTPPPSKFLRSTSASSQNTPASPSRG
ncbi:Rho GTPase activation protein [Ceraceosorus guamensis]|uniref:Rho GTPase activation protein n=1 Tax=Ceraceosorus guamensis TaxID=1522189 RepID=A0A316VT37_9BASI|nr:Rho GTPase activation protein [Ceraceosorus guamensis]PWN40198.1 Rho GTPase activation protein [Ceraceosorus guamensis]